MKPLNQRTKRDGTPFDPEIPLWQSKNNNDYYSVVIDEAIYDQIQKMEIGGRLMLQRVTAPEGRELSDRAPKFRLRASTRSDEAAFRAKYPGKGKPAYAAKGDVEADADDPI